MLKFIQYHTTEKNELCGCDGIRIVDGRYGLERIKNIAIDNYKKLNLKEKGVIGYKIRSGSILHSNCLTQFIKL